LADGIREIRLSRGTAVLPLVKSTLIINTRILEGLVNIQEYDKYKLSENED